MIYKIQSNENNLGGKITILQQNFSVIFQNGVLFVAPDHYQTEFPKRLFPVAKYFVTLLTADKLQMETQQIQDWAMAQIRRLAAQKFEDEHQIFLKQQDQLLNLLEKEIRKIRLEEENTCLEEGGLNERREENQ